MAGEYMSTCGCKIHVIQWTSRRKVVTQQSCPLHKNAQELLESLKGLLCVADRRTIEFDAARKAIAKAEGK